MAAYEVSTVVDGAASQLRLVQSICLALIVSYAVFLAGSYLTGHWLVAADGSAVASDFVNVWATGRAVIAGHAAAAYDWSALRPIAENAVGHRLDAPYGWHYPPPFLFVAAALSLLPYAAAYGLWMLGTFPAYAAAIRAITGDRFGYLLAAAFPASLANVAVGQTGFLSAGLIGGALILIQRRPLAAGVLLGLLTYKPHLGLLFPVALIAGGHWRVFASAIVVTALLATASWLAFGTASWSAFVAGIRDAPQFLPAAGSLDWAKLQTPLGLTRRLGGSETLAWTMQAAVTFIAAGAIALLWCGGAAYEIKAAALGTAAMLATPYLFTYDLVVLAVPIAFLFRLGRSGGFLPYEIAAVGSASLLILVFILPSVTVPVGFVAVLIVAALLTRRALTAERIAAMNQPREAPPREAL